VIKASVFIKRATIGLSRRAPQPCIRLLHLFLELHVLQHQIVDGLLLVGSTHLPHEVVLLFLVVDRVAHLLQLTDCVEADHWPHIKYFWLYVGEERIGHRNLTRDIHNLVDITFALRLPT